MSSISDQVARGCMFRATSIFPRKCISMMMFRLQSSAFLCLIGLRRMGSCQEGRFAGHAHFRTVAKGSRTRNIAYWWMQPRFKATGSAATPFGCNCAVKQRSPLGLVQCEHFQQTRCSPAAYANARTGNLNQPPSPCKCLG